MLFKNGGVFMATVPTQVRIDENLKKQASELFAQLGMDMSGAMNIFLRQCVLNKSACEPVSTKVRVRTSFSFKYISNQSGWIWHSLNP